MSADSIICTAFAVLETLALVLFQDQYMSCQHDLWSLSSASS